VSEDASSTSASWQAAHTLALAPTQEQSQCHCFQHLVLLFPKRKPLDQILQAVVLEATKVMHYSATAQATPVDA
jgi:hypothetical protein